MPTDEELAATAALETATPGLTGLSAFFNTLGKKANAIGRIVTSGRLSESNLTGTYVAVADAEDIVTPIAVAAVAPAIELSSYIRNAVPRSGLGMPVTASDVPALSVSYSGAALTGITSPIYYQALTTLVSAVSIGATTLPLRTNPGAGDYLIDGEAVTITGITGSSSPFTATLSTALTAAHASGAQVSNTRILFGGQTQRSGIVVGSAPSERYYQYGVISRASGFQQAFGSHSIYTDAPVVAMDFYAGFSGQILVDGLPISQNYLAYPAANGVSLWLYLTFTKRRMRRITFMGSLQLSRIAVDGASRLHLPTPLPGPTVGILDDSYGGRRGQMFTMNGPWGSALARFGWYNVLLSQTGGTGYLNDNGGVYRTYRGRVATDVLAGNPNIIINSGGLNDQGRQSQATLQAEATLLYQQQRASQPNALIIVDTVATPLGTNATNANYVAVRDALLAAIQTIDGPWGFIDEIRGTWRTSNGRSGPIGGQFQTGTGIGPTDPPRINVTNVATGGGTWGATGTYYYKATLMRGALETLPSAEVAVSIPFTNRTVHIAIDGNGSTGKIYRGTTPGGQDTLVGTITVGATLLDTGTGSAGTPPVSDGTAAVVGDGNADFYIQDGTHANEAGTDYLGAHKAEMLAAILNDFR